MAFKGSWTEEEDSILRDLVMHHGEGKWCLIARSLPGRIGKQCRERWINHLNPDIKKNDIWTVEEDMALIEAHRACGPRWSRIASFLPGRPENDIKNHWNSNKRSLKSKRRLKKKKSEQVPPGQLTVLEEYIRSVEQGSSSATPEPPEPREINLNNSLLPDLNITYDPQPGAINQTKLVTQDPQEEATFNNFSWFPVAEPLTVMNKEHTPGLSYYTGESSSNIGANGYHNEAGPSNIYGSGDPEAGDTDTNTVLELASREFIMPSSEEVSLGLDRFK